MGQTPEHLCGLLSLLHELACPSLHFPGGQQADCSDQGALSGIKRHLPMRADRVQLERARCLRRDLQRIRILRSDSQRRPTGNSAAARRG
jgi:hypothetical protein